MISIEGGVTGVVVSLITQLINDRRVKKIELKHAENTAKLDKEIVELEDKLASKNRRVKDLQADLLRLNEKCRECPYNRRGEE